MANTKPFVALACVCENVLQDKDGVLSLIRVIDTVYAGLRPEAPKGTNPVIEYKCIVSLKSGDLVGSFNKLALHLVTQNGKSRLMMDKPIPTAFSGGANGINVQVNLVLEVETYGLVWIDVRWDEETLTRIPLDIKPLAQAPDQKH